MPQKTAAQLATGNSNTITNATNPESITPANMGALLQDFIDSFWNKSDTAFTLPPTTILKADLAIAIGASTLQDKRYYGITDRADGNLLIVQAQGVNKISPYGLWVVGTSVLAVIMDYANGKDGESNAFFSYTDASGLLWLNKDVAPSTHADIGISKIMGNSAALDFPNTGAGLSADLTIAVTGAVDGDTVLLGVPISSQNANTCYTAFVSSPGIVTVRFNNYSSGSINPASGTFKVKIIR